MGEHQGFFNYTRGQRRGLGVAHSERLYVLETKPDTNEVIVGTKEEVFGLSCTVGRVNWFLKPESNGPIAIQAKIRSQHEKADALLYIEGPQTARVEFDDPQDAITPGQGAVFYQGTKVIGGGWIDSAR